MVTTLVAPEPYRSGMLRSFGPLYYLSALPFFFRNLRMEDHSAERIRHAHEKGPVVYVLHTRSHVDWLALNRALVDRRLPLPVFSNGLDAGRWMGVGELFRMVWQRIRPPPAVPDPLTSGFVARTVAAGVPVCVFMAPQRDLRDLVVRREEPDPIPALLEAQRLTGRPVQILPVVVIWDRSPEPARTEVGRFLLGTEDNPGLLGKLSALARGQGNALVQVGEPVSLADLAERTAEETEHLRLRKLKLLLRRYLYREARVVRGPRARPRGWVRRQVLDSREVTELIRREAQTTGADPTDVAMQVVKTYGKIAADFSYPMVRLAAWGCRQIWTRIYSGIDVRPLDLERIRAALRDGTPVLVPCHRSHLDYLLISSLLHDHDIVIPHIVAGDNLSFWPLGAFFRRCGAFFIRRSFTEDRIFPVVFERYLRELIRMEVPVEFFIEGGRSRTGKLLPPKVGVLGMVMDATATQRPDQKVSLLPIYVGYEQIAEERAYARELGGEKKEKEDVGQVVKAAKVLTNRYGKVYLRVGEPLDARALLGDEPWDTLSRARRGEQLMSIAERLLHGINREALALPTSLVALAILAHPRRGVRHEELKARVERVRAFLRSAGVNEGGGVQHVDGILAEALDRFVKGKMLLAQDGPEGRVYSVVTERRTTLEYYKNAVLHAFAPASYYANAVRAAAGDAALVNRLFWVQQFTLRYEFVLDPDADEAELQRRAIVDLVAYGALDADGVTVSDRSRLEEIGNLTANFLESYLLVLRGVGRGPLVVKDASRSILGFGQTLLAADEIARSESLNLQNIDNAVRAFREDGAMRLVAGKLELVPEVAAMVQDELARLLGAPR